MDNYNNLSILLKNKLCYGVSDIVLSYLNDNDDDIKRWQKNNMGKCLSFISQLSWRLEQWNNISDLLSATQPDYEWQHKTKFMFFIKKYITIDDEDDIDEDAEDSGDGKRDVVEDDWGL